MRIVTVITLLLLLGVSYGLYQLKYQVEGLQDRATALNRQIAEDQRAIKVLQAEWAYLTRPQRLQRLSDQFLHLEPVAVHQIAAMDELRLKDDPAAPGGLVPDLPEAAPGMAPAAVAETPPPALPHSQPALPVDTVSFVIDGVVE